MKYTDKEILDLIVRATALIENDGSIHGPNIAQLNMIKKILVDGLDVELYKKYKEQISNKKFDTVIFKGVKAAKGVGDTAKKRAYNQAIRSELGKLKKTKLRFLFLVNVEHPRKKNMLTYKIDDYVVEWYTYDQFIKTPYHFSDYYDKTKKMLNDLYCKNTGFVNQYGIVSICVTGYDIEFCLDKACEIYDKFLGLINFSIHLNNRSTRYGLIQNSAYSDLTGMNIIYVLKRNKFVDQYSIVQYSTCKMVSFDPWMHRRLKWYYKKFRSYDKRYDIRDDISNFLILYQRAMKSADRSICFLYLWQILEMFLLRKDEDVRERSDDLICRAKCIFNKDWDVEQLLDIIRDKRNNLVHRGVAEIDENDIFHVKFIAEGVFRFFILYTKKYNVKPYLYELLELLDNDRDELLLKKELIRKIIRTRT